MLEDSLNNHRPLRLLVVEDSRADAELMIVALKRAGYVVSYDVADSQQSFLRALAKEVDAVLCDHNLGSWSGMEALALLRSGQRNTPFILITGTIGEEAAVEYIQKGADGYVLKNRLERLPIVLHHALLERLKQQENLRLQEAILFAKQEWELTFDTVTDAVMVLDKEGIIRRANRGTVQLVGLDFSELLGKPHEAIFHHTEEPCTLCPFRSMLESGVQQRCDLPQPWLNKTFDVIASPMRNTEGALRGGTLVMRDISDRLKMDEQLRQAQKMEAVGLLAGGIAHDFNNLLSVISGNAEMLASERLLSASQERQMEEIVKAVRRAAQLTSQLLAFSRRQVLQPKMLDINAIILEVQKMLQRLIGEDIHIIADLQAELGAVRADQTQLEQVLMNLATNARDAMPEGGKLIIRTCDTELDAADQAKYPYIKPGPYVRLSVMDTGKGMNSQVCDRVFEPFFTTKEKGHGTGLGLSVAYGVVKQSGGYIWVNSEPEKGTAFDIYLPRVPGSPLAAEKPSRGRDAYPSGTETVMVVEDEDAVLQVLRQFLVRGGYSVLGTNNPNDALKLAQRHKEHIPLVIMDTILPEMSGPAAAVELKKLHPESAFLFISGYVDRPILKQFIEDGSAFLQKPISRATLLSRVDEMLHASKGSEKAASA